MSTPCAHSKRRSRISPAVPSSSAMTASFSTASRPTCSLSRATAMSNGSRAISRITKTTRSAGSGWRPKFRIGSNIRNSRDRDSMPRRRSAQFVLALCFAGWLASIPPSFAAPDPAFAQWLESLWPAAQSMGVSRRTFDTAARGLEPDLSLPDLDLPGRVPPGQPEFAQSPAEYLSEATISRLAEQGRRLASEQRTTLAAIKRQFGVPANVVLAIWGRETAYGTYKLPYNAVRVLATQAYIGKRKEKFRDEFLLALKIVDEGHVKLADMRSSWAGAMGLTQFLPSEFYKHGVDFDGDGRIDIFNSVPDALASAARQLRDKGWQTGKRWAYEVRPPRDVDCTLAEPSFTLTIG